MAEVKVLTHIVKAEIFRRDDQLMECPKIDHPTTITLQRVRRNGERCNAITIITVTVNPHLIIHCTHCNFSE